MELIHEKLEKWIPSKNKQPETDNILFKFYSFAAGIDFSPIIKKFKERIDKINYKFAYGAKASGAVCFFGSSLMSLVQLGYIKNVDKLLTFSSCYMLIDHYLDDDTISMKDKTRTISQINKFIEGNYNKTDNTIIKLVADKYIEMESPKTSVHLKNLFKAEVKTMRLQTKANLNRETYLQICEIKGGLTCNAIQSLIGLDITGDEYILGSCIQLVDDILDIDDDISLNINTIATHDYRKLGNLDNILVYTINKIDNMNNKYNLFKPILYLGLMMAIHTNTDKFSDEMIEIISPFIHYESSSDKDTFIELIRNKIDL